MSAARSSGRPRGHGFTLLELVLVIALLSILAGAALPVATRVAQRAARRSSEQELGLLGEAAVAFYADVGRLPRAVAELERPPAAADGWAGPYLSGGPLDPIGRGGAARELDGWSRPYRLAEGAPGLPALVFASAGADGVHGNDDDLTRAVELAPLLRERTLARLALVNEALAAQRRAGGAELTGDVPAALASLVEQGFLPALEPFARDAWGRELVADPPHARPLVRVRSASIGAGSLAGGPARTAEPSGDAAAPRSSFDGAWGSTLRDPR